MGHTHRVQTPSAATFTFLREGCQTPDQTLSKGCSISQCEANVARSSTQRHPRADQASHTKSVHCCFHRGMSLRAEAPSPQLPGRAHFPNLRERTNLNFSPGCAIPFHHYVIFFARGRPSFLVQETYRFFGTDSVPKSRDVIRTEKSGRNTS